MAKLWEFFAELNEPVYVTDTDSYELLYMNKRAMECYGIRSVEEYAGKRCYEILQGCLSPCATCNNRELSVGNFREMQYYNPKIDKHFLLKDTVIEEDGRRLRLEIAVDITAQEQRSDLLRNYQTLEITVNNGIRMALNEPVPDKSLDIILEYIGHALNGERTYIFERNRSGGDDNTYEWVAAGVTPEKENLQNLPSEVCANWYMNFSEGRNIVIEDLEDIRESDPLQYDNLKRQNIHSIAVVPLYLDGNVFGFYGIDNPPKHKLDYASNMLQIMGHFIVSTLKRRNLIKQLQKLSFTDQLTGLGNRHAMEDYLNEMNMNGGVGVIFGDITGLKMLNDTKGHSAGDKLICDCADSMKNALGGFGLFRVGGDELLALCNPISELQMEKHIERLRAEMSTRGVTMAIGYIWVQTTDDIQYLIKEAERRMYAEKAEHYRIMGIDRRRY